MLNLTQLNASCWNAVGLNVGSSDKKRGVTISNFDGRQTVVGCIVRSYLV